MTSFVSRPQAWNLQTQIGLLESRRLRLEEQEHEAYRDELGLNGVEKMEEKEPGYDNRTQASPSPRVRNYYPSTIDLPNDLSVTLEEGRITIQRAASVLTVREEELTLILQICSVRRFLRVNKGKDKDPNGSGSL